VSNLSVSSRHHPRHPNQPRAAELQAEIARISKQNCVTARNNLEQLNRSGQIRYRTGEGEVLRLSEDDRKQRIEEAGNQVKEFCKD
jgi:hypothetical protein